MKKLDSGHNQVHRMKNMKSLTMEINTLQLNTPKATIVFGSLDWVTKKDGYCQSDELMTNQ